MKNTRKTSKCKIFEKREVLKENVLPTFEEVMQFYEYARLHLKTIKNTNREPTFCEIAEIVTVKVESIWKKTSIPTVSHARTVSLLKAFHSKCKKFIKSSKRYPDNKRAEFVKNSKILFDICCCKCKSFEKCTCPRARKVPKEEHLFLSDQRSRRNMRIGGIDRNNTKKLHKRITRLNQENRNRIAIKTQQKDVSSDDEQSNTSISSDTDSTSTLNSEVIPSTSSQTKRKKQLKNLPGLSKMCDRYGVSDRAAAAIVSAAMNDIKADVAVIDKSKIRRERKKSRKKIAADSSCSDLPALYFDGRKDKTLSIVSKGNKKHKIITSEEHISIIKEPDSIYIGHSVPSESTAICIERSIYKLIISKNVRVDNLMAIGCDGTVTNTGRNGGVIRLFEKRMGRPLQWIICLLHLNKLPLRHIFIKLDGNTSGPSTGSTVTMDNLLTSSE